MQTFLVRKRGPNVKPFYNAALPFIFFQKSPLKYSGREKGKLSNMTSQYTTKIGARFETKFDEKCKECHHPKLTPLFLKKYFKNIRQIPFLTTNLFYDVFQRIEVFFSCAFISSTLFLN
jgi:hypothetical protein